MAAGKIAEFLASVGFKADENSLKSALSRVAAFGASMQLIAAGVTAGMMRVAQSQVQVAREAENLRTGTRRLEELRYVAEQTGAATGSLDGALKALGDKYPRIKDTSVLFDRLGAAMARMTEAQQKAYAKKMGIDPSLIPMLTRDVSGLKDEFARMYALAGTDAKAATEASQGFLAEIGKLKMLATTLAKAVSLAFIGKIRGDLENLRRVVMENFGTIRRVLEFVIGLVLRISGAISAFVYRAVKVISGLVDWFGRLDDGTRKLILGAGALLAAWKLLGLGFLATPLGAVIAALAGIVALIDDYLTYMEGGESYFDWNPYAESIEAVRAAIGKALTVVAKFARENKELLIGLAKFAAGFVVFGKLGRVLLRFGDGLAGAGKGLLTFGKGAGLARGALKGLFALVRANPFGLLITAAMLLYEHWDKIKAKFPNFAEMCEKAMAALASFGDWLLAFFSGNFDEAGRLARQMLEQLGDMALAALSGLAATVAGIFSGLWAEVRESFPDFTAWTEGAAAALKGTLGKAVDWIREKLAALVEWMPDWAKEKLGLSGGPARPAAAFGGEAKARDAAPERAARTEARPVPEPAWQPYPARDRPAPDPSSQPYPARDRLPPAQPLLARSGPPVGAQAALTPGPAQAAALNQTNNTHNELNAKTEIHMHSSDPIAAGNQVAARQGEVNAATVRHMRGVAR